MTSLNGSSSASKEPSEPPFNFLMRPPIKRDAKWKRCHAERIAQSV